MAVTPQSHSPFSASFQTFCLTARAYLNTQKYGLFCSLLSVLPICSKQALILLIADCFQNGNPQDPNCNGIHGVLAAYYHSIERVQLHGNISDFILLHEKFLQFDWLRAVVFQLNLKYLHVKITKLLRVVV